MTTDPRIPVAQYLRMSTEHHDNHRLDIFLNDRYPTLFPFLSESCGSCVLWSVNFSWQIAHSLYLLTPPKCCFGRPFPASAGAFNRIRTHRWL